MPYGYMAGHTEGVSVISILSISLTIIPDNPMPTRNSRPEQIIMVGPCRVSIFRNVCLKDGQEIEIPKVVLEVRYKDKQGRWRGTQGMTLREIPKAILALQKAFEYLQAV